jgi:hypothetical protein
MIRKRSQKNNDKLQLSLWNFKNRKLVIMMKMINSGIPLQEVEVAFPYFTSELFEHSAAMMERKAAMVKRVATKFLENLRTAVIFGRRRQFKEAEVIRIS